MYNKGKRKRWNKRMEDKKILIIEDEKPIADILKYSFEKEGFQVECAHTGSEGFSAACQDPPDLILLDWMLPGNWNRAGRTLYSSPATAEGEAAEMRIGSIFRRRPTPRIFTSTITALRN